MDPKNLPNLDPKLKEVYERVMQTPTQPIQSQPAQPPPPKPPAPPPPPTPTPTQAPTPPPVPPTPNTNNNPMPQPPTSDTLHSAQVFNPDAPIASPPKDDIPKDAAPKGKTKISPVVLVLVGVVFFVIYAVFWVSFFNVSLPF